LIFAQQPETKCPAELKELLQGKSSDFTAAASQLKETDLPVALAVIELLKFKALHQEIPASLDQINNFESQIVARLENSSVVSFTKTDTCRKKVEATEIKVAGQKIAIPEYYISEAGLTITGVIPTGEAGTVFPDIQVNLFSQSNITEYSLVIDGNAVQQNKIGALKNGDELGLIFRPDLNADSILAIGTHTAEILIANEAGEKISKQWHFTVGVKDISTPPLPEGTKIIKEMPIDPAAILPGGQVNGNLSVIVYQDANGRRYSEYKLTKSSGAFVASRNLAFIAKKMHPNRLMNDDDLTIRPRIRHAFIGNNITFSHVYSGPADITSVSWDINSNGIVFTRPGITIHGNTVAKCTVEGVISTGPGDGDYFSFVERAQRIVRVLTIRSYISSYRSSSVGTPKPQAFDLEGWVYLGQYNFELAEGAEIPIENESEQIPATLKVDKLRWKITESDCQPKIKNVTATTTSIIFTDYGLAEVVFDVELTYSQDGLALKGFFEPQSSALYAYYPVSGKVEFESFPSEQLIDTRRMIHAKKFNFAIKNQQRIVTPESGYSINPPVLLGQSSLWPASSPIQLNTAIPLILTNDEEQPYLEMDGPLSFFTPKWLEAGSNPLVFSCYFSNFKKAGLPKNEFEFSFIENLPPINVYKGKDILLLNLDPDTEKIIPEGFEAEYKSSLSPIAGYGNGMISENSTNIDDFDVLDGYKITAMPEVEWFEDPDWVDNANWSANPVTAAFSHIFTPTKGVGSYTLRCRFNFKLEESETKDSTKVAIENAVPVSAIPGLRILSPIEALCYPLNQTIKVTTTMDSVENNELWQNIKWQLNGEPFKPDTATAPFELELKHKGKWKLEAELETIDPVTGDKIVLYDSAEFDVVNIDISLTPDKKVVNQLVQKTEQLKLSIIANGNEAVKPGTPFVWQRKEFHAVVDPIEWQKVIIPNDSISVKLDPQSLLLDCDLKEAGAATFLATVTIRIIDAKKLFDQKHKGFKDEYEEPVFAFPVTRADLWAVKVGKLENESTHFPEKAIAQAYRTYDVASFSFEFSSSSRKPHSFNKENGLQPPIVLKPALPGDFESISGDIGFKWEVTPNPASVIIEQELVKPGELVIKPLEPCGFNVAVEVHLDFDQSAKIKLGDISTTAQAVDLFSLIETKVEPSSFTITLGDTKKLRYIVSSLENDSPIPNPGTGNSSNTTINYDKLSESNVIYLLDKSYALSIEQVLWSYEQNSPPSDPVKNSIEGNPYVFQANAPGDVRGKAKGILEVQELKSIKSADFGADANFSGNVVEESIQILVNGKPLGSEEYHMGQKITLSYKVEPDNLENVIWSVENPLAYKSEMNTRSTTHTVKNYKVEVLNEEDLKQKQIEFYLYDFDPEKVVKNGSFTYQISGDEFVKEFKISYEKPVFTRPTLILPPGQDVDISWDNVLNKWRFGFSDIAKYGIYAEGQLVNNTKVNYMFGSYQLISVNAARSFIKFKDNIATNPSVIQQFLQTIKKTDSFGTLPKFWLDTTAPQDDKEQRAIVSSHADSIIEIANDRPSITLDETMGRGGSLYYAGGSFVKEEFLVYVFAKPTNLTDIHAEDPDYYQSIWFPVAVFAWSWEGSVTYDLQEGWAVTGTNTVNLKEKSITSFSSWPDVAIGDFNPKWRDL
jgi:hypothetical protein